MLLALIISMCMLPVTALAANASASLTGPGTVRAGDTITLTFQVNGSGLYGVSGSLSYDKNQLTLQKTVQKIASPWVVEWNGNNFVAYDNNLASPIKSSKAVFTATFKVNSSVATGTAIKVSCTNVTASDGSADVNVGTTTYAATIAAPLSGDCALKSLTVNNATISPAFNSNTTSYKASVGFEISKLDISAVANDNKAKVSINNPNLVANGTTNVVVTVTAENGAKKSYTIAVTRAQDPNYVPSSVNTLSGISVNGFLLSPVFNTNVGQYIVWLPYETESVSVSATPTDGKARVEVIGGATLAAGRDNEIKVVCTAEDGSKKTYVVIAKRAAAHDGTVDPEVEENTEEIVEDTESTEMENSEESKDNNSITVDCYGKEKDISNGDKIKVSFDDKEGIKKLEEEFGVKFTRTEAEIEVWGNNEYGESSASVPKKSTIDLAEYVTFKVEGEFNGYAYILPSLNVEKLLLENKDSLSTNVGPEFGLVDSSFDTMKSRLSDLWFDAVNTRTGKLSTSDFTNDQGLKNGDVVKIQPGEFDSWLQNANAQGLFKLFNVELTCSPIEYTVEGLKDVVEVDVFQDFTVEYEGANGKASIQLIRMNIWVDHYNCLEETAIVNSEKDGTLSNGDILILDISKKHSLMDRLTSCYGVIPTRTQIEVTVEGLD